MQDKIYEYINNKTKSDVLRFVVFAVIFIVIIEQIYLLSRFVYKYDKYYDYGDMLKKACLSSYTEYETSRFQLMNNMTDLEISNNNYKDTYNIYILILTFIVSLYIAYFFSLLCVNISFGNFLNFMISKGISGLSNIELIKNSVVSILNQNIFTTIFSIIKGLIIAYMILIIPIFFIMKINANIDISPFVNNTSNYLPHIIVLIAILSFQMNQNNISLFTFNIFFSLFIISFFILKLATDVYLTERENSKERNMYENSENKNLKYLSFVKKYFEDINNSNTNILSKFIMNIMGFNDIKLVLKDNYKPGLKIGLDTNNITYDGDVPNIDFKFDLKSSMNDFQDSINIFKADNYKNLLFVLFVLLLAILFIWFLLYFKPNHFQLYGFFSINSIDRDLLYNFAFIPLLILYVIIFIISMTKEYNTFINKYILYKPNNLYKRHINDINNIFNQIIQNDSSTLHNFSTCKNIANAIHMSIYSSIFKGYNKDNIFVPELEYEKFCDIKDESIDYTKIKEYDIEYYLKNNKNVFYNNSKCSSVNNELLTIIMINTIPKYTNSSKIDFQGTREQFRNFLKFCINNVLNYKTYDGTNNITYSNNYISNNKIHAFELKYQEQKISNEILELIDEITEEYIYYIQTLMQYNIKTIQALCKCNKIEDITSNGYDNLVTKIENTIKNNTNGEYSLSIKKDYIENFTRLSKMMFFKINKILSFNVKSTNDNLKLTKYIIKNYNDYQENKSDLYRKNTFNAIDLKSININNNVYKFLDIKDIQKCIEGLYDVIRTLNDTINEVSNTQNTANKIKTIEKIDFIVIELKDKIDELLNQRNIYVDLFKSKYYYDNDYKKQLIYDYKISYIDSMIKLHTELLQNSTEKNIIEITQGIKKYEKIDFDTYKKNYDEIIDIYNHKYDILNKLSNDVFKTMNDINNNRELNEAQKISTYIKKSAEDTSINVYITFFIYLLIIIIANIVN